MRLAEIRPRLGIERRQEDRRSGEDRRQRQDPKWKRDGADRRWQGDRRGRWTARLGYIVTKPNRRMKTRRKEDG